MNWILQVKKQGKSFYPAQIVKIAGLQYVELILIVEKMVNAQNLLQELELLPVKKHTNQLNSDVICAICPKCQSSRSLSYDKESNRFKCAYIYCHIQGNGVIDLTSKSFNLSIEESTHILAFHYNIAVYEVE